MLVSTPDGRVVDVRVCLDGRLEISCAACGVLIYHDAIFVDDVVHAQHRHEAGCRHTHPGAYPHEDT